MQRRTFLEWSLKAGALTVLTVAGWGCSRNDKDVDHPLRLPSLPYEQDALEPYLSEETLRFHYGKHHQGYVDNANRLLSGTALQNQPLATIMQETFQPKACAQTAIFNNAAQAYNHTFYWNSMKPGGGGKPGGVMADWIAKSFGSYDAFRNTFAESVLQHFASGWTWLVLSDGKLRVVNTTNAVTPLVQNMQPVLVIDDWEHAYYLDYQNRRDRYVDAFLDHLVNWEFAAANLGEA